SALSCNQTKETLPFSDVERAACTPSAFLNALPFFGGPLVVGRAGPSSRRKNPKGGLEDGISTGLPVTGVCTLRSSIGTC
ncbi:MAG TPA: hypothetical protein VKP30_33850, partial [Polyangiaceae bacterium]|nr:hypothetical protein [Polyangiaceae bacterium]